jgi:hypothetical protein
MGSADREPRPASVDQIEIDKLLKRPLQRRGRIVTGALRAKHIGIAGMSERIGPEEAGDAVRDRRPDA